MPCGHNNTNATSMLIQFSSCQTKLFTLHSVLLCNNCFVALLKIECRKLEILRKSVQKRDNRNVPPIALWFLNQWCF